MLRRALITATTILVIVGPAVAWDEAAIAQLKQSKNCTSCDLKGADLRWANVYAAELGGAPNLVDAVMDNSDLSGANLFGANLEGASLRNANLSGANLSWGSLIGADLTGADMTDAKMAGVLFCKTKMPDGEVRSTGC